MANLQYLNKADGTQDLTAVTVLGGSVSVDTGNKFTGIASFKCATTATTSAQILAAVVKDSGTRIVFRVKFDTLPAAQAAICATLNGALTQVQMAILMNTNGTLANAPQGVTAVNGTKVLATNTWYRITLSYVITSSTVFTSKIWVDGVLDSTVSNSGTLSSTGSAVALFEFDKAAGNANIWFDSIYVDDGTTLDDPGNILVTAKRPFANGTTNGFTTQIGSGGSGYGSGHAPQVNERPLSQTNGWSMVGAGSAVTEEYNVEGANVGDVPLTNLTLIGYMGWIFAKSLANETASLILNNTTTNAALTSTPTYFVAFQNTTSYPPGAGKDIGMITATTLTTVSLYECGILIAYKPNQGQFFHFFPY